MKKYYDAPTQVGFIESKDVVDEPHWLGGIAFGEYVICGECGCTVELCDIDQLVELPWVDINESIMGDEVFDDISD